MDNYLQNQINCITAQLRAERDTRNTLNDTFIVNVTAGDTIKEFPYVENNNRTDSNNGSWSKYAIPSLSFVVLAFCVWFYKR